MGQGPPSASPAPAASDAHAAARLPTLSVVVPNYNHAQYLPASLPAIARQSFPPLEVIVLDDASTDDSLAVIERLATQFPVIRLVRNEKNLGVMPNLNKGVGLCRGDYIFIASADDEILPGLFEKSMQLLAQYPQAAHSCTLSEWRYVDSGLSWHMSAGMADGPAYLSPEDLVRLGRQGKLMISSSSIVFRKEALCNVHGFIPELRWHADWFAAFISAFRYGLCYVPECLSLVNILPKSFYTAGRKGQEHEKVLLGILERLNQPEFADVRPRVRDSGALSLFATPMLRLILSRPEFRYYFNSTFLCRTLRRSAELAGRRVLPTWLARWILNRFYRAEPVSPRT